jgi:hypothetical protein
MLFPLPEPSRFNPDAPLVTKESPLEPAKGLPRKVVWTKPELICEVRFANWTEEGRLRAPVFLGLREDLDPPLAHEHAALLAADLKEATLTVDKHRLKFTNLDKLFYPKDGYRKRDVLNYYNAVAPLLLPYLKDRPLSLKRYPNGVDDKSFFEKRCPSHRPVWIDVAVGPGDRAGVVEYCRFDDRPALVIGFVNATLGVFLKIVTFPLVLLTLGLFWLVINAAMIELASAVVPGFHVDTFGAAFVGAIVLALVNMFFRWLAGSGRDRG